MRSVVRHRDTPDLARRQVDLEDGSRRPSVSHGTHGVPRPVARQYAAPSGSPGDTPRSGMGLATGADNVRHRRIAGPGLVGDGPGACRTRSRHGPAPGPSGTRRRGHLVRRRGRGGLRSPPAGGHRPVACRPPAHGSADGRWVATYNGECYNTAELRAALPDGGRGLRGHCDTEVVVEAVAAWGLRPTWSGSMRCSPWPCGTAGTASCT